MEAVFTNIRESLAALRASSRSLDMFGSQSHDFGTHPPLAEEVVLALERAHRVTLPAEYRGFLIHVGNGGAGPYYGLFKLGEMDDGFGHQPWIEGGGFVGTLSHPFPHAGPWNDLSGAPQSNRQTNPDHANRLRASADQPCT